MAVGYRAFMDLLTQHAQANGAKAAVIVDAAGGGRPSATSFAELEAMANRLAHALYALGAEPGDRIAWCGPNSLEVVTAIHAGRKAALTSVPVSYRFNASEMQFVIDNSDATVVVVDAEQAPEVASVLDQLPKVRGVLVFGGDVPVGCTSWAELLAAQPDTPLDDEDGPSGATGATMIYTSGTTGRPKGAMRTGADAGAVGAMLERLNLLAPDPVHITTGPLYHSGPLSFALFAHAFGGTMIVLRKFDPSAWLRLVKEHRVTDTFTAPTQLKRIAALPPGELARADVSSMRTLIANAAPVPYALKQELIAKLGDGFLYEVYGSTELGVVTILPPEDQLRKPGSCGKTYGPIEVRIVRDDGTEAPIGEPGELFIRTTLEMDGYHHTDERLTEHGADWKSVGDVAYLDDEGYLFICDRKKDMIISGGVNIYPAEIEAVIHEHPGILDAAVLGVPDDEWGERVHAIVQPRIGVDLDLDELRAFVEARVGGYKRPRDYEVRDELPRTDSGKLLKRVLRDEFWGDRETAV
jgi:acyl-CoA synthetase (AMP-forming)/AMP-acid ligase II